MKKRFSVFMAFVLVFSAMPINALAQSQPSDDKPDEQLIQKADEFVVLENGLFSITNEEGLSDTLTSDEFETVENLIEEANSNLQDVDLSADNVDVINNSVVISPESESSEKVGTLAKEGKRGIKFHWTSVDIWLTKTDVSAIRKGGVTGGATYLGSLFGVAGAVAGAVASTVINQYTKSEAIKINHTYTLGVTTITPQ